MCSHVVSSNIQQNWRLLITDHESDVTVHDAIDVMADHHIHPHILLFELHNVYIK